MVISNDIKFENKNKNFLLCMPRFIDGNFKLFSLYNKNIQHRSFPSIITVSSTDNLNQQRQIKVYYKNMQVYHYQNYYFLKSRTF